MSVFLYNHGGSANHGCEAILRTVWTLIDDKKKSGLKVYSDAPEQDAAYGLSKQMSIMPAQSKVSKSNIDFWKAYLHLKMTRDYFPMDVVPYLNGIKAIDDHDIGISIGGDIYCYEDYMKYIHIHNRITRKGCKTILLGCSMELSLFQNPKFIEDMRRYSYITARETISYELFKQYGFENIAFAPDSAFLLPAEKLELPNGFQEGNTIGLNVSPLIAKKHRDSGMVFDSFSALIRMLLEKTDSAVALIPHVIWKENDDRTILDQLFQQFQDSGRVVMIPDCNCMQLKGYISRCRFFIASRTHAAIAAYSSKVPTLVLGYSVKAKGIAKDIFGSDEHYVLPIQELQNKDGLIDAYTWLASNEIEIRDTLEKRMPAYIDKARDVQGVLETLL